jgi:hypothetical protein
MKLKPKRTIADHFASLEDPRLERTKQHKLIDIITIAICAVICGADTWVAIETYGKRETAVVKKVSREDPMVFPHTTHLQEYLLELTHNNFKNASSVG